MNKDCLRNVPKSKFSMLGPTRSFAIDPHHSTSGARGNTAVLIVDDHVDCAISLGLLVGLEGYAVSVAHDGFEAVQVARRVRPTFIFMDIDMPRMNGLDAVRRIRKESWGQRATICAVTGRDDDITIAQCKAAGFDRHLAKPAAAEDIFTILNESPNACSSRAASCG